MIFAVYLLAWYEQEQRIKQVKELGLCEWFLCTTSQEPQELESVAEKNGTVTRRRKSKILAKSESME